MSFSTYKHCKSILRSRYSDVLLTPGNDLCGISFYVVNADGKLLTHGSSRSSKAYQYRSAVIMDAVLTYQKIKIIKPLVISLAMAFSR